MPEEDARILCSLMIMPNPDKPDSAVSSAHFVSCALTMRFTAEALVLGAIFVVVTGTTFVQYPTEFDPTWYAGGGLDYGSPPQKPLPWPGPGNETIYTTLSNDKEYTKLVKAINFADKIVSVLNDSSAEWAPLSSYPCTLSDILPSITFFAVSDSALRQPHRPHLDSNINDIASLIQAYDLSDVVHHVDEFEARSADTKDDDRKQRKKFLKKLVRAILSYHILPSKFDAIGLADNNTFATNLVLPDALGSRSLRIRVAHSLISPTPTINFYSRVVRPDGPASNGIIHGVNHPLLPPPPVFQELFMAPSIFSTFTSAIQRTGLTDSLDMRYVRGKNNEKGSLEGATAVTVFAPSNHAFQSLPKKLGLFLFSPFGTRVLRKLLQYHIVPDLVFHTGKSPLRMTPHIYDLQSTSLPDYQYNKSESTSAKPCKRKTFDISKLGPLGTDLSPLRFHDSQHDCHGLFDDTFWDMPTSEVSFPDKDSLGPKEKDPPPSNPFQFNIRHHEEILAMDTETYEALTDAQQDYVAQYLELYDILTNGMPSPHDPIDEYPVPPGHSFPYLPTFSVATDLHRVRVDNVPPPGPAHSSCAESDERARPKPISSFDATLPTALTNHSINAHVEKFNISIPIPGPRRPHRISTKFTVDGRYVVLQDIVGLNGAVHVINQLLDPRGHHPHHPRPPHHSLYYDDFMDMDATWEDWEHWLPRWAAEN
ncbi:hypothetical protein D9615_001731 [Tricholomella constricta]|uniref:FAS1 domain-containing protein n=1 Tax=Tricholomella constricta TaxID=117010 RepID=A0A8H5M9X2_9AGAR|nr:hypothetical protein D9615_001731 [Tricholomella constricta]